MIQQRSPANGCLEIVKIHNKRFSKETNRLEYLVQWRGLDTSDNTWVPYTLVGNCLALLGEYEYKMAIKQSADSAKSTDNSPFKLDTLQDSFSYDDNTMVQSESKCPSSGKIILNWKSTESDL